MLCPTRLLKSRKTPRRVLLTGEGLERQRRRADGRVGALLRGEKQEPHEEVEHRHHQLGDVPPDVAPDGPGVNRDRGGARAGGGESLLELLEYS